MYRFASLLAGFSFLASFLTASAQQPAARLEVTGVAIEGRTLSASVAVLDAASNPVVGLSAGAFRAQVDGSTLAIGNLSSGTNAALPLGLVFAVDTSGSMAGTAMTSAKTALLPLVTALQAGDQAALLTFAQTVSTPVPVTSDQAVLSAGVQRMQAAGNTALFAGVSQAASAARALPQPRKAVVLLSDGEDFGNVSGGTTREQALEAARSAGVPFFVVGLGLEVDQSFLTALAAANSGQYFAAASPAELAQLYTRISDRLRQQYTIRIELPGALPAGDHRLSLAVAEASGFASFSLAAPAAAQKPSFTGLPAELAEATVVRIADVPAGVAVRFAIDGAEAKAEADGRSIRLDPYAFEPLVEHTIAATGGAGELLAQTTFRAAALAPRVTSPTTLPNLRPGDLVRLSVQAQPGSTTVSYIVDGREIERDAEPPFEFVLPDSGFSEGLHTLRVVLSNGTQSTETTYEFPGADEKGPNVAAYLLFGMLALAALVAVAWVARRGLAAWRERPDSPPAPTNVEEIAAWVQGSRREEIPARVPVAAPSPEAPADTWGTLTVLAGPGAGESFLLSADVELVGRGNHASIRLKDSGLEPAHFIVSRDGFLTPSTPSAEVFVGGERVRRVALTPGTEIRAASTVLVFRGP